MTETETTTGKAKPAVNDDQDATVGTAPAKPPAAQPQGASEPAVKSKAT